MSPVSVCFIAGIRNSAEMLPAASTRDLRCVAAAAV